MITYEEFNILLRKRSLNLKIKEFLAKYYTTFLTNISNELQNPKKNVIKVEPQFIKVDNTHPLMNESQNDFTIY